MMFSKKEGVMNITDDELNRMMNDNNYQNYNRVPEKKKKKRIKHTAESKAKAELKAAGAKVSESAGKVANKVRHIDRQELKRELFYKKNTKFDPEKKVSSTNKPYVFSIFKLFRDFVLLGVAFD